MTPEISDKMLLVLIILLGFIVASVLHYMVLMPMSDTNIPKILEQKQHECNSCLTQTDHGLHNCTWDIELSDPYCRKVMLNCEKECTLELI